MKVSYVAFVSGQWRFCGLYLFYGFIDVGKEVHIGYDTRVAMDDITFSEHLPLFHAWT